MTFKELSEYFQKLESTASRNEMVVILAQLFKEASVDEIDKVVYLTQGRVAPLYEPVEFGMAEKMVLKAMALATDESLEMVTKNFKQTGDLGETAEKLSDSGRGQNDVKQVFEKLTEITKAGGEGSVEKKIEILANLFKQSSPLENRFLARIPVDKMRLGFSDMTVLEGLSWMLDGTKKHKDSIESAYNVRPDLGFLARAVKIQGLKFKSLISPVVGTPILVMRAERLNSSEAIMEKMAPSTSSGRFAVAVEPKIDGLRTQLHVGKEIRIYSRGLENVTAMYPDLVAAAKKELTCDEVILDGESIAFNPKTGNYLHFQETVTRKRKYDVTQKSIDTPLKLIAFDVLYYNGKSLLNEPYLERRKILEKILDTARMTIIPARMTIVDKPEELKRIFDEEIKSGQEGIMAKKLDGVYQAGARGWNWIKLKSSYEGKLSDTIDAVVMGYDFGQGKRNKFGVGAFLIGVYDQKTDSYKTVSKVGTGLTDEEWRQLKVSSKELVVGSKPGNYDVNKIMDPDIWLKPKLMGVFRADQITKSPMHTAGYALRFPRLDNWRTDKQPEDATSLKELEEMVKLQK